MIIPKLQAIFFDFDGVLVDSNHIKTEAFYDLFHACDEHIVEKIIAYHRQHGGISRVVKIQYAHEELLQQPLDDQRLQQLSLKYSELVVNSVISADWITGAESFLKNIYTTLPVFVISGTPQEELELIIEKRNMTHYFKEIAGSPVKKTTHLRRMISTHSLTPARCVFVGDAHTDYHAAKDCHIPFIGIQGDYTFPDSTRVLPDCTELYDALCSLMPK